MLHLFRNKSKEWTGVTVNGEEIISTPGHKYYLPNTKAWVSAEELEVGINVLLSNGGYGIIEVASKSQASGRALSILINHVNIYKDLIGSANVKFIPWEP